MCGIFSIFLSKNDKIHIDKFRHALRTIKKRGPDATQEYITEHIFAGFQRLAINDLSESGNQPMFSDDKHMFLQCNGEIFNYKELAEKYHIHLKTKSDCEILLKLYETKNFFPVELNGDFAFCLHTNDNKVILCRDRIGVRPLFYGITKQNSFMVASELKCFWPFPDIKIFHVPPGQIVTYDIQTETLHNCEYYNNYKIIPHFNKYYNLKDLLIQSTKKRLLSDRPIGCLLSGGLDSSIICAILCSLIGPENVRTYSIGMEGSLDLHYAKKVSSFLNTKHTEVLFTPEEGLRAIPDVIYHLESYDITTVRASVGMYLLGKYISQHSEDKVIFSGEGSDELFCGYLYFHYAPTPKNAHDESLRLISELYKYDVLRADRCISSHGLELRVPFLDPEVIEFAKSLSGECKAPNGGIEKKILRDAFKDMLPDEILQRRKDGFSDGVSSKTKSWYEYIKEYVEEKDNSTEKEAKYYKDIYNFHYFYFPNPIDKYWMPKWIDCKGNPSGRILKVFNENEK